LEHTVVHVGVHEEHWSAGGLNLEFPMFPGLAQTVFLSSPVFDITALHKLNDINQYLLWLQRLAVQKIDALYHEMDCLSVERPALFKCIQRMPGPLLCGWAASWTNAPATETMHKYDKSTPFKERFNAIVAILHDKAVSRLYYACTPAGEKAKWCCQHQVRAVA
jgi:hypothetical protein